jgi:anaerobic magnesium-protoporphyrin IX monomethyl ester cyclase
MKVLLVDPPDLFLAGAGQTRQVQPLGLGYIGAVLASDHDVRFLLPDTCPYLGTDPWAELARVVRDEAPDLVGLTAVTATYPSAARFAELVKGVDPEIPVVLGGVHASTLPAEALAGAPAVDFVVRGEGEETLRELAGALEASRAGRARFDPGAIAGLHYRDEDGAVRHGPARPSLTDLDAVPFPLREGLVYTADLHPAFYQAMVTLRGCPYQCIYCAVPSSNDRLTRYRSAGNVVDELAHLRERHAVSCIFFHDSVFSLHRKRTIAICDEMLARDLVTPFHCQTRADRVDPELLALMKRAGCEQIFFGIESGDLESLARIRKKMPLEQIRDAVAMVREHEIRCTGFFMIGFPWETREHIERTAEFATSLELDAISLFSATPLPGTELWDLAGTRDLPDSLDFRAPQVNTTALADAEYGALFARIKARVDAFNQRQMYRRLAREQPLAFGPGARVSWLD